jgi:hypothetical protein
MIQLYLLILIIIFLLTYFYNENRELFQDIPDNLISVENTINGIQITWKSDGERGDAVSKEITSHNYYLIITNTNTNLTYIKQINPTIQTNNFIKYEWLDNDASGAPDDDTTYNLTINRMSINLDEGGLKAYNTISITRTSGVSATDDLKSNCKYDTVKSDFFNNLKGKKFNIYI